MFDPIQYKKIIGFCDKEDVYRPELPKTGVAYQDSRTERIKCMEDCDMDRGRGKPKDCRRTQCNHYIFINKARLELDKFLDDDP